MRGVQEFFKTMAGSEAALQAAKTLVWDLSYTLSRLGSSDSNVKARTLLNDIAGAPEAASSIQPAATNYRSTLFAQREAATNLQQIDHRIGPKKTS
jgi:hypothetical protein